ncbi:MAG TPA: hypothetical protein VGJ84_03255, partial [Polyangiaceae bacterium]
MHRVSMLMLRLPLRVFLQAVVLSSLSLLAGCSGSDSKPPVLELSSGPTRPSSVLSTAPCEPWTTRPCGIELGVLGGTVRCQRGTQICEDGVWSACMADASKHSVSIPAAGPATSGGVKLQDVGGGSSTCVDNPCDPVCLKFNDEPSSPASADRVDTPTGWSYGGSLASSNVPTAFKDKGSLNAQCSAAAGSQSFNEACQFDQHCNGGSCTAFGPTDSGSCSGIDITAPTSCIPITSGFRDLTVCNRGTVAAPAGIRCYRYPGGAPQYPNDDPGTGTLVMTTATTLQPGTCETQQVPESLFGQNGIQSIMCNPPQTEIQVVSVGPNYAATNAPLPNLPSWTNPANGYASDGQYATAAPPNPNGAVTGPKFPSANQTFGSDGSWTTQSNAYSDAPAGAYATASPAMPASSTSTGNIGPVNPTTTVDPAVAGDGAWSSVWNALAPDGSYTSAAPANPSTPTVVTKVPSSMLSNSGWINPTNVYASDSQYATATLSAAGTVSVTYGTFGFNSIPANAILDSLTLTAKWKGTVNSSKYHLTAQAVTGGTDTPIGLALTKSDPYTGETTDSLTVPATTLSQFVASDFTDANFHVLLSFVRDNGSVSAATASVDAITVSLTYHLPSTVSSFAVGGFGITGIPSGAPVQMTIEVKWKTDVVNSNVVLGLQAYKNWGTASQATIGSELTRTPTSANTVYTDTTPVLAPTPNDLSDSSFKVRVRVLRNPGSTNPDFTAFVDSVRVTVSWTATAAPAPTTSSLVLTNFGLDSLIPA